MGLGFHSLSLLEDACQRFLRIFVAEEVTLPAKRIEICADCANSMRIPQSRVTQALLMELITTMASKPFDAQSI